MKTCQYPVSEKPLGIAYSQEQTTFRVWAPTQENVDLAIYKTDLCVYRTLYPMTKDEDGVYEITIRGDLEGKFYTFIIGDSEVTDPYSIACSENSERSAIVDLSKTNPEGWEEHSSPSESNPCDAVIYELNLMDYVGKKVSDEKGAYLGLIDSEERQGYQVGLSHLISLGVTHVHLLPINDFLTVDENKRSNRLNNYNWGYDPEHFNVPEGSYSTNPQDPKTRISELKKMIMELHRAGIKVILDVVYNHTYRSKDSNFNVLVPDYYYRMNDDGTFSNGSGVGNEMATERPMVRKFILDSVTYWVEEYKVDGFRFDLLGLIDMETIRDVIASLDEVKSGLLIYGEPWTAAKSVLPVEQRIVKGSQKSEGFAVYNDNFRDGIKGGNDDASLGFIQGNESTKNIVESGITGMIFYDTIHNGFTTNPTETINYVNSHDNLILYDKIKKTCPDLSEEELIKLNKFALAILFTAQGIPLIHEGNELMRTKKMVRNSYNSPPEINEIDWSNKHKYFDLYVYVRELISLRKAYSCFRMSQAKEVREHLNFIPIDGCVIAYTIKQRDEDANDFDYLLIIHNATNSSVKIPVTRVFVRNEEVVNKMKVKKIFDERGAAYSTYDVTQSKAFKGLPQSTVIYQISLLK